MSIWRNVKYAFKKGALMLWGPAQLDPRVDPNVRLDREHDSPGQPRGGSQANGWDKG